MKKKLKKTLLLIEDNETYREGIKEFLQSKGFKILESAKKSESVNLIENLNAEIDLILSDLKLPDGNGLEILKFVQSKNFDIPVIFITGQPDVESAVEALKSGAWDYLVKPVELEHLYHKIQSCLDTKLLKIENLELKKKLSEINENESFFIGVSANIQKVYEKAKQIAPTEITVLIEGESGTGKEVLANFIYKHSQRKNKPFVKINCGAIVKSLLEAELFGVVKGAYTGADKDRPGIFESANGGTIFLDEIGELDMESQVRLLRVMEDKTVYRVGSTTPIQVDVRIIAATNKNLLEEVEKKQFREDLYYRLAVAKLILPPLRERKEDIPLLFNHFVVEFNEKYGKSITKLSQDVLKFFQNYDWPGNIRQFRNVLESMVVLAKDDTLTIEDLPEELLELPSPASKKRLLDTIIPGISLEEYEKAIIQKNLEFVNGNREKAAELLGISQRTLYRKIIEYSLYK
ncbi:MAG: sigma-54 dependent transcriptional regulator [Leptospiraceae bacterium]|nr:sigma-54 dependent transcriptional regulator [Leptospiraceae bacterium]MDW7976986.1 sigma-54 dependent transcriptional regulator [Leptospiraceae bacterium]